MTYVFGIDQLAANIRTDFADRGVTAEVLVGEWNTETMYGAPRVVVGFGDFDPQDPAGMRNANEFLDQGDGTVAQAIIARVQTFNFWVHSVADPATITDPTQAIIASRDAASRLLDATLAALRRTRGGLPHAWTRGKWVDEQRADRIYGAVSQFGLMVAIPVPDDAMEQGDVDAVEGQAQADIDGTLTPPETVVDSEG